MFTKHNKFVLSFLFAVLSLVLQAQVCTFRAITMDNGLSNFVVNALYKDATGFMWIGTDNSLDRFDGIDFKHYYFQTGDINKKRVKSIVETTPGTLYVSNSLGLWKLNREKQELELQFPDKINCSVTALNWDSKLKKLYIGSNKGLFILDNENNLDFVPIDKNVLSRGNNIMGIVEDHSKLWITTRNGLCEFDKSNKKIVQYDNKPSKDEQYVLARLTRIDNTLYIGTSKIGILCFNTQTHKFYKGLDVGSDIITDVSGDGKNTVYVATDGNGVHFISHKDNKVVRSIQYEPKQKTGIRSNSVYSLLVDRDGIIWVGYYQAGLDYSLYQNPVFHTYSFLPSFDSEGLPVRSFLIADGEKLIGTREGLYYVKESARILKAYKKPELRSNLILSLCKYQGEYYIGTYGGGASILNPSNMSVRKVNEGFTLTKGHVFHFEEDKSGNLWMATSGGLYRYNKSTNQLTEFNSSNSQLLAGNVYYIFFDSSGKGWVATENGLYIYDPSSQTIKSDVFPDGFFNNQIIKVIREDSNKRLYFCPDKGNIYVSDLNMQNYSSFTLTQRFKERVFLSFLQDKAGNYWFGSDNGLIQIKKNQEDYHSFGFSDGVPDAVFSTDASYMDQHGILWFGNAKGLLYVDPHKINVKKLKGQKVQFTDFQANGGSVESSLQMDVQDGEIGLNYNENNLKIRFVSLVYTNPSTLIYEYKLEGYDKEWQILHAGQNEILFNNLPAGSYILHVRLEGNVSTENVLKITIHSFFSYKFWIVFLIVIGSVFLLTNKLIALYKHLKEKIVSLSSMQHTEISGKSEDKYKYAKLNDNECEAIKAKLIDYIELNKPYSNPNLKIVDLALAIGCSSHSLSYLFNQYLTKNYYDFINEYRIQEFKRLVESAESAKYTLSALAEQCGFSSRASFFRSFKKLTGITPNEYIRSTGKVLKSMDSDEE